MLTIPSYRALVRPGRFDRTVAVPLPDIRGRAQILQHHMRNVTIAKGGTPFLGFSELLLTVSVDADPKILARGTPGFSGADLQNLVK